MSLCRVHFLTIHQGRGSSESVKVSLFKLYVYKLYLQYIKGSNGDYFVVRSPCSDRSQG